jgi:hypothetical protein
MAGRRMRVIIPAQSVGTGGTAKTLFQVRGRVHQGNTVKYVLITLNGKNDTNDRIDLELFDMASDDGTFTDTATPVKIPPADSTDTLQTTFHYTVTVEPTTGLVSRGKRRCPPTGREIFFYPDGALEKFSENWGVKATNPHATDAVDAVVEIVCEE